MLQHFRSYGMKDLNFIVVNSKLSHARAEMPLLQERVSFEVFQETEKEPVWDTLEGGKDDMYIYDRCGRLTYFIPFPLSIMNEETSLIQSALMATYFRSPCGVTCDERTTPISENDFNDGLRSTTPVPISKEVTDDADNIDLNPEMVSVYNESDRSNLEANTTDMYDFSNISDIFNLSFNESDYVTNNETDDSETSDFYNLIQRLFRNDIDTMPTTETYESNSTFPVDVNVGNDSTDSTDLNENDRLTNNTETKPSNDILYHQHEVSNEKDTTPKHMAKVSSDRCAEADFDICKSWSKKKLLRAQRCCSSILHGDQGNYDDSCQHFGKRRCKKIKTLLKCCIKTAIIEVKEETTTEASTTEITTEENGYVCCKTVGKEKLCRVSDHSGCEDDELLEQATNQKK